MENFSCFPDVFEFRIYKTGWVFRIRNLAIIYNKQNEYTSLSIEHLKTIQVVSWKEYKAQRKEERKIAVQKAALYTMSNKTKVKLDNYGLYVRGGGYLWRPEHPDYIFNTLLFQGDEVTVNHFAPGMLAYVKKVGGVKSERELWYNHGYYIDFVNGKSIIIPSEKLFNKNCLTSLIFMRQIF